MILKYILDIDLDKKKELNEQLLENGYKHLCTHNLKDFFPEINDSDDQNVYIIYKK